MRRLVEPEMKDQNYHYLFSPSSNAGDFNRQMYWLSQQPTNWASKGMRLRRDASFFYETSEKARLIFVTELERSNFNFGRFYRWELQERILQILNKSQDYFLPDFDTYYLLMHLAIENVLKAIWLDHYPENIGFDKLPRALNTHDLCRLAAEVNLSLSTNQEKVLSKIGELFLGYSRYPIRNRVKLTSGPADLDFGEKNFDSTCIDCLENPYAQDKQVLDELFTERLQTRLEQVFANSHERMQSTFDFTTEGTESANRGEK